MQECHYDLIKELLEIEILKKNFYSKPAFSSSLSECKKDTLEGYTHAIEDLLIGYVHIFHELENIYSEDAIKKRLKYLVRVFQRSSIKHFRKGKISKLFYLFCVFKDLFERDIFSDINQEVLQYFRNEIRDSPHNTYELILAKFYSLIELSYLFMSGLQINCLNLSTEVLNSPCFDIFRIESETISNICNSEDDCNLRDFSEDNEYVHFFILPEYKNEEFIETIIAELIEFHNNSKNINIVIDYKLHPSIVYTDKDYKVYELIKKSFKSVIFANSGHIDFGEYRTLVNIEPPLFRDAIKDLVQRSRREGKVPLTGEILTTINKITHDDIRATLKEQELNGMPFGQLLEQKGLITHNDVIDVLRIQKRCKEELPDNGDSELLPAVEVERILKLSTAKKSDGETLGGELHGSES
jgi:hypothetical protein